MTGHRNAPGDDPVVRRAIETLRALPSADAGAVQRVVTAAANARLTPAAEDDPVIQRRSRLAVLAGTIGVAAAAVLVGVVAIHELARSSAEHGTPAVATLLAAPRGFRAAAFDDHDALPVPQQFVLTDATAKHASVVGDFNGWDASKAPMTRSPDGRMWSVTLLLPPGRHMYAFMVDDSLKLDPREPTARDPDLGVEGSVVIVGRP
jgi:hypothetical protein